MKSNSLILALKACGLALANGLGTELRKLSLGWILEYHASRYSNC